MPDRSLFQTREAVAADLPAIVAIYNEAVATPGATADLEPVTVASREAWFASHQTPSHPILVAEREGVLLGWASLSPHRPGRAAVQGAAEVSYYVASHARRQGVARHLVREAIAHARAHGLHHLFTWVLEVNIPSIRLLEGLGFELWGRLPDIADLGDGRRTSHVIHGIDLRVGG